MLRRTFSKQASMTGYVVMGRIAVDGTLSTEEVPRLTRLIAPDLIKLAAKHRRLDMQLIGTSVMCIFSRFESAATFALDLRDYFANQGWNSGKGAGRNTPETDRLRIAVCLHFGELYVDRKHWRGRNMLYGPAILRAQRIEELVPPNHVFMSAEARKSYGRDSAEPGTSGLAFQRIPGARLSGNQQRQEFFWLGRSQDEWSGECAKAAKNSSPISRPIRPQASHLQALANTEEMFDFIKSDITSSRRKVRHVRCSYFNGGATLERFLATLQPSLAEEFEIEILVWDHQSSVLPAHDESPETKELQSEVKRLHRFIEAHGKYNHELNYKDFTELSCEYLLLGSRILNRPARHPNYIDEIEGTISLNFAPTIRNLNGSITVRKTPYYMPGRIAFVDDIAFVSLYLHAQLVGPIIMAPQYSLLFERLGTHFDDTWQLSTGTIFQIGSNATKKPDQFSQPAAVENATSAPNIFVSYRRDDSRWPTARLYDRIIGEYGSGTVFMDTKSIEPGKPFPDELRSSIEKCELMLVMIGPNWQKKLDERSAEDDDWVVNEISLALQMGKKILTVLIDCPEKFTFTSLPVSIASIANIQKLTLNFESFDTDADAIIKHATTIVPPGE